MNLDAYLDRVGYAGPRRACIDLLSDLTVCHAGAIPFENVDVRLGRPIRLDLDSIEKKLVASRRGGYCFEQNTLFAAALRALGFEVATLEARVRPPGEAAVLPRTHMVLRVDVEGRAWLSDVGFGSDGPLGPVPLDGGPGATEAGAVRVEPEGERRVLRRLRAGGWRDLYVFGLEPALPIDYEVANFFTSNHPRSPFVTTLTAQIATPEARFTLRGRTYTVARGDAVEIRELAAAEVPPLLRGRFGLDLSVEDLLRALG